MERLCGILGVIFVCRYTRKQRLIYRYYFKDHIHRKQKSTSIRIKTYYTLPNNSLRINIKKLRKFSIETYVVLYIVYIRGVKKIKSWPYSPHISFAHIAVYPEAGATFRRWLLSLKNTFKTPARKMFIDSKTLSRNTHDFPNTAKCFTFSLIFINLYEIPAPWKSIMRVVKSEKRLKHRASFYFNVLLQ